MANGGRREQNGNFDVTEYGCYLKVERNESTTIHVRVVSYGGREPGVDIRQWVETKGYKGWGTKGIALRAEEWTAMAEAAPAVARALAEATKQWQTGQKKKGGK